VVPPISFRDDEVDEQRGPLATRRGDRAPANGGGSSPTSSPTLPGPRAGICRAWDHFARPSSWRAFGRRRARDRGLAAGRLAIRDRFELRRPAPRRSSRGLPELAGAEGGLVHLVRGRRPQAAPRLLPRRVRPARPPSRSRALRRRRPRERASAAPSAPASAASSSTATAAGPTTSPPSPDLMTLCARHPRRPGGRPRA